MFSQAYHRTAEIHFYLSLSQTVAEKNNKVPIKTMQCRNNTIIQRRGEKPLINALNEDK